MSDNDRKVFFMFDEHLGREDGDLIYLRLLAEGAESMQEQAQELCPMGVKCGKREAVLALDAVCVAVRELRNRIEAMQSANIEDRRQLSAFE